MEHWCHICGELTSEREDIHAKTCPGYGHPPRPPRQQSRGVITPDAYTLSSGRASKDGAS